jgi:hypothetical protein
MHGKVVRMLKASGSSIVGVFLNSGAVIFENPGTIRAPHQRKAGLEMNNGSFKYVSSKYVSSSWRAGVIAIFGVVCATGFLAAPAAAQGTPEQQQACQSDALRLCGEFVPDVAKITACMAHKRASLSPACRASFAGGARVSRAHASHVRSHRHHR